jgi:hypothetical protein
MPKQVFTVKKGAGQQVEIEWKGRWKDVVVRFAGQDIGGFADFNELKTGKSFKTPGGGNLSIQYNASTFSQGLEASYDGEPLGGAANDPETRWRNAFYMAIGLGVLNLALGAIALLLKVDFLRAIGIGEFSILFGLALLSLGFWARQGRSTIALVLAVIIFGGDGLLGFFALAASGMNVNPGGLVVRFFLLLPILQGIPATMELNDGKIR